MDVLAIPAIFIYLMVILVAPALVFWGMRKKLWVAYVIAGLVVPVWFIATASNVPGLTVGGSAGNPEQYTAIAAGIGMVLVYWWTAYKVKTS
jgi:hypothetical protein